MKLLSLLSSSLPEILNQLQRIQRSFKEVKRNEPDFNSFFNKKDKENLILNVPKGKRF